MFNKNKVALLEQKIEELEGILENLEKVYNKESARREEKFFRINTRLNVFNSALARLGTDLTTQLLDEFADWVLDNKKK